MPKQKEDWDIESTDWDEAVLAYRHADEAVLGAQRALMEAHRVRDAIVYGLMRLKGQRSVLRLLAYVDEPSLFVALSKSEEGV